MFQSLQDSSLNSATPGAVGVEVAPNVETLLLNLDEV